MSTIKMSKRMMERDFKGIWIPREIYFDNKLNWIEKILLLEIDSLDKLDGGCYASNQYLGDFIGKSKETAQRIISKLKRLKIIKETAFDGRKRVLKIEWTDYLKVNRQNIKNLIGYIYSSNSLDNIDSICKHIIQTPQSGVRIDGSKSPISENGIFHSNLTKRIITRYNKEKNILCRVNINKRTKVIENIEKNIRLLKEGKFQTKNRIDDKFRKLNNIPFEDKKYSITEIEEGFRNLVLMFDDSYHPITKPKGSLSSLIYNPVTKGSWLLEAIYNPPKLIKKKKEFTPDHPEVFNLFKEEFKISNDVKLNEGIETINEFQKQIPEFALKQVMIRGDFGSLLIITKTYITWLKRQEWLTEIHAGMINAKSKLWDKFIDEYANEKYGGFNLKSKK